jgi:hypothetical protein
MTIALIVFAIGLASAVLLLGHFNDERRQPREQPATIRARRPKRRPF